MDKNTEVLFELLSFALGKKAEPLYNKEEVIWKEVMALSFKYEVPALVFDGYQLIYQQQDLPTMNKIVLMKWLGQTLSLENQFQRQFESAKQLSELFWFHKLRTYVLKGFSIAQCYPVPSHRFSCDFDCFVVKKRLSSEFKNAQEESDRLIEHSGVKVDRSYYKNSSFNFEGLHVENHRYCCSIKRGERTKKLEIFLEGMLNEVEAECIEGTRITLPPLMFQAVFLVEHACAHFLYEKMSLKNICDWAMFRKCHQKQLEWEEFDNVCERFGLQSFAKTLGNLADFVLGDVTYESLDAIDKKVLEDTLKDVKLPKSLFSQRIKKGKDVMMSRWKFRHFNKDSMIKELSYSIWAYVFKKKNLL